MKSLKGSYKKSRIVEESLILKAVDKAVKWFYTMLIHGFFGKLFTSYSAAEGLFESGALSRLFGKKTSLEKDKNIKLAMARSFECSRFFSAFSSFFAFLLNAPLKECGAFLVALGVTGLLVTVLKVGLLHSFLYSFGSLLALLAYVGFGAACLASKKRVSQSVCESRLLGLLLFKTLGLQKDIFKNLPDKKLGLVIPTLFGIAFGGLVYFVSPEYIAFAFALIIVSALVVYLPESGVLMIFASVPLAYFFKSSSAVLLFSVGLTTVSFVIKVIRGKRVFKIKLIDFSVVAFMAVRSLSGLFGAGGIGSFYLALYSSALVLAYFLTVNLIKSKEWIGRAVVCLTAFSLLSCAVGLFQMVGGGFESGWLDSNAFSGIRVRITSAFENPNNFGAYLLLVFPFSLSLLLESKKISQKIFFGASCALIIVCLVETWSRGAWLGAVLATVIFFLMTSRKYFSAVFFSYIGGAGLLSVAAPNVALRFSSIADLSETSVSYRISAWRGVLEMLKTNPLWGIGFGEASFLAVYPDFALAGAEAVRHAHSLYLQLLVEGGIAELLVFLAFVYLFYTHSFEFLYKIKDPEGKGCVIAGACALLGILIMGATDYVWYNSQVFLMFWAAVGLAVAAVRIGYEKRDRLTDLEVNTTCSVDFEIDPDDMTR